MTIVAVVDGNRSINTLAWLDISEERAAAVSCYQYARTVVRDVIPAFMEYSWMSRRSEAFELLRETVIMFRSLFG